MAASCAAVQLPKVFQALPHCGIFSESCPLAPTQIPRAFGDYGMYRQIGPFFAIEMHDTFGAKGDFGSGKRSWRFCAYKQELPNKTNYDAV